MHDDELSIGFRGNVKHAAVHFAGRNVVDDVRADVQSALHGGGPHGVNADRHTFGHELFDDRHDACDLFVFRDSSGAGAS